MQVNTKKSAGRILALLLAMALCLSLLVGAAPGSAASSDGASDIFFSQYIEGKSNNKALEIYNGTGSEVDLSGYTIELHANGNTEAKNTLDLSGTLADGEVMVFYHSSASDTLKNAAGDNAQGASICNFNGEKTDYIVLLKNGVEIDVIGSKDEQSPNHKDYNLIRRDNVTGPNSTYNEAEWDFTAITGDTAADYAGLGSHTMNGGGDTPVTVAAPQASPQAGEVTSGTEVTLTCSTAGASIYYTLDGREPGENSEKYETPIAITGDVGASVTLKAVAIKDGVKSTVQTLTYTIKAETPAPIADGDKVVIYNPAYNMALSAEYDGFYNKGAEVTVSGDTLSGYGETEVWTVIDNGDGTWSFSYGGQKIGMGDEFTSMPLGEVNDRWELVEAAGGCWYIHNHARGAYMEWFVEKDYWSAYYNINTGSEDLFALKFYKVEGEIPEPEPGGAPIADGDKVGIYLPGGGVVITTEENSYSKLVGADATLADGELTTAAENAVFTVEGDNIEGFKFAADGKYLTTGATGNNLTMEETANEYSLWILEPNGDDGWFIKNKNAKFGSNAQYIEFYFDNFTTYSKYSDSELSIYTFQFYPITTGGGDEPGGAPFEANDTIVIYAPSNMMALSAKVKNDYYPIGVEVTVTGDEITGYGATEVWTVGGDENGWTFTSNGGKTLSMAGSYSSAYPGAGDNETWALEAAGTEGQYYVKNVVRGTYLFWDDEYDDWTTRDSEKTAVAFRAVEPITEEPDDKPEGLEVWASPVSGTVVGNGDTIELTAAEGATIYYTTDGSNPTKESAKYAAPIEVGTEQVPAPTSGNPLVVKAVAVAVGEDGTEQTGQVCAFTYNARVGIDGFELYFGQLHSHTDISDGAGSVENAFYHAANEVDNLDFLAVTDHSNSFDNEGNASVDLGVDLTDVSSEWKLGHETAEKYTGEDFVGIYGFEMTWSDGFGHINTFNTPGFESRSNSEFGNKSGSTEGYQNYYDKLVEVEESLSQFNHPGTTFGDFQDFSFYDPQVDQRITLIEVGNGEGAIGSSGYFPSYEYYTRALDKGWHVAPTNNQDNHKGNWGDSNTARSVVLAGSLTEEAIYDAIANYRVYATEDNDLSILYSLNGNVMGSILGEQESVNITANINDPTDSADMKVEVIVNGGLAIAEQTVSGGSGTVNFNFDSNDYSYYYLRVTQADGNIAVTAPVWTGEAVNAGISKTECDTALVVKDEAVNISSEIFNNTSSAMTVKSLVYSVDGKAIYSADLGEIGTDGVMAPATSLTVSFPYTFASAGKTTVDVAMTADIGGTEYTFNSVLQLSVTDASLVTRILVDGTHYNDYVNGYYAGNMGNLTELGASMNAQVKIKEGAEITAADLEGVSLLIVSAPIKYNQDGLVADASNRFSDAFIKTVSDYVNGGGTVIVCGLADYQDGNNPGANNEYTTYNQINKLLEGIGASVRVNDDELLDQVENGGQQYRLYFDDFNFESADSAVQAALAGLEGSGKVYSSYSGCSVSVGDGAAIVYGHETTYSINSKAPAQGHNKQVRSYSDPYNENDAVVRMGDVVSLATEAVGSGRVYVGGTVWMSDFEVANAEGNDYGDASYANKTIITNIISGLLTEQPVSKIEDVRENTTAGAVFTVEGTITAGNVEPNAFYDTIYIQDETGGINIYPVATTDGTFKVGQKVRVTGSWDQYQGDTELRCISIELIDSAVNPVEPAELTLAGAKDYAANGGLLAKVSGTVKSVAMEGDAISAVVLTDGTNDFRLLFNNYIGYSDESSADITTFVKEGAEISAVGVVYMDPEGVCLRVRDLSEVVLVSEEEPDEPDRPSKPSKPSKPEEEEPEAEEPFYDVDSGDWFYDAVVYVYSEGMMDGVDAGTFSPDGTMTRAMFWTVLARIDGEDTDGGETWYVKAQDWAVENGVSDGTDPDGLITREMLATMLWRYAGEPESDGNLDAFTDAGSVSDWALEALIWAVDNGIVTGMTDTTIVPQGSATRAQAAIMFMRYMSVVK